VSRVFWQPMSFFRTLGLGVLPPAALAAASAAWKLLLLTSAAGLFTRFSTAGAFVLGTYLMGIPHSFGKIHHDNGVLVFAMGILAFSRCGDGWSVDSLARAARRPLAASPAPNGEFTWPIRMMWLVMSLVFFGAGVSKLRHSGLEWITSNTLQSILLLSNDPLAHPAAVPPTDWGLWLAGVPWLCMAVGAASLALELFFPLALFSRLARRIVVPGVLAVQIGISLIMGPDFLRFLVCYLFWVPWKRMGEIITRAAARRPHHALIYDGACGLCRSTVAVLRRLDIAGRVEFLDALSDWPRIHGAFPSLSQEECLATMHVVTADGRIEKGFDAYRALSWSLPLLWPVAPLLYVPGVPVLGRRIYASVAARRHRTGCPVVPAGSAVP
jgi:predicted DCC family thiol-disulfide oxidoreductase YuxK